MNRTMEFRLWDKENKIMYYNVLVGGFEETVPCVYIENRGWCNIEPEHCIIMQYTGLKDKKGKKIYEGDIIKSYEGNLMQVHWYNNGFKLYYKFKRCYQGEEYWETRKDIELGGSDDRRFGDEVVGHIFEE